ncbi:SAM-dependent methyltransferase [Streptacidiphilus pinicola]|uniref:SAM-dependent methyltransferase n=1 Tax=Streptacidiphilus pinicola TaxID=2219663 RepID=A0A2X0IUV7_9ACTN|nr:class I SAM-dependent methyltransferase [Streptacidiphilus pinicola]RAG87413.1 SAM-dependent methyltransferase [Streptacidiphilus pinicola]
MAKIHPTQHSTQHHGKAATPRHDYLPAAGRDAFLPFYDRLTALLGAGELHRTLLDQAGLADGQRVLEIGCGTGNLALRAKRSRPGIELVGSDPDPLALARAERKAHGLDGIRFERGYAQRLDHPDASFDRVLSALMFHHLDEDIQAAAAAEVRRVLRPGGSLHLVDFSGSAHGLHGRLAGRMMKSGHFAAASGGAGDSLARVLGAAGLHCTVVASRRHPLLGQVTYYRAVRDDAESMRVADASAPMPD